MSSYVDYLTTISNLQYVLGGSLIGLGISSIYIGTSIIPGPSTFLESTLSCISTDNRFQKYRDSRIWRMIFTAGIILGATAQTAIFGEGFWTTNISISRLFLGGLLVGIGTRIGKGCASGHGISGVSSLSKASIMYTVIFLGVASTTAMTLKVLGVTP